MKWKRIAALAVGTVLFFGNPVWAQAESDRGQAAGNAAVTAYANGVLASETPAVEKPSLKLESTRTVYIGSPVTLKVTSAPKGKMTWKSSDRKIATVNTKGKVTGKKTGTVRITVTANGIRKACKVTVKKPSLRLNQSEATLYAGDTFQLKASAKPKGTVKWRSSNGKVAKVNSRGIVTGQQAGTAKITASAPGIKKTCSVTVLKNSFKLNRTRQTMMTGSSVLLYTSNLGQNSRVSYEISDSSAAALYAEENYCRIEALRPGTATVSAVISTYANHTYVTTRKECIIKVIDQGVTLQQSSVAVNTSRQLELKNAEKAGSAIQEIVWKSSNETVAKVSQSGIVTGKSPGSAKITAVASYQDNTQKAYSTSLKVSSPRLEKKAATLAVYSVGRTKVLGINSYSTITWESSNPSVAAVSADGTIRAGGKKGSTRITALVDGKTLQQTVTVTNPQLSKEYVVLSPGQASQVPLKGISSKSRVSCKSQKPGSVSVTLKGKIRANSCGNTKIIVTADGKQFTYLVQVVPKRVKKALSTGYQIMYTSSYSQAYRMSAGYYDCSSLVFRAYGCDSGLLGGSPSWAPTAASMAQYMERTGKVISYSGLNASKLRPGDLIFYGGTDNGRYKNIYHVSMYYGGSYRLEKPLRYYYPESSIVMIARPVS